MNTKQKKNLARILLCITLMIVLHFAPITGGVRLVAYLVPYLIVGYDILLKSYKGIKNRRPMDEALLMTIATVGAFVLAVYEDGDYTEAIAVMLFYQVGEWFQSYAVGKSRENIGALMDIRPDYAKVEENGELVKKDPDEIEIGTEIVVTTGEKIPIDGIIIDGTANIDTSALTGESLPRPVGPGREVLSGAINLDGVLHIRTTKEFGDSTAAKILELAENAAANKAKSEDFIAKFARIYTPAVVGSAAALALLPPLYALMTAGEPLWGTWLYRALTFLVISCPCALVVSIPMSFFAGIGGASSVGILVKGANYMETLANVSTVVFDKTGTLTKGTFDVTTVHAAAIPPEDILHLAAHAERYSAHPIAVALKKFPHNDDCNVTDIEDLAGYGIRAKVNGKCVCVGNEKLMEKIGALWHDCHRAEEGIVIHAAVDGEYAGHIIVADRIKENSAAAITALKEAGVKKTVMLTGDAAHAAAKVAAALKIDAFFARLLPADKVAKIEEILASQTDGNVAFVGDGINDAPVLSRADVGIAMGALGSDAAIEAADVVLMDDDPLKITKAIKIARKTLCIVKENIYFAVGVKFACLALGALGLAGMWAAIFADVGVMVLAVLNAMRAMAVKNI